MRLSALDRALCDRLLHRHRWPAMAGAAAVAEAVAGLRADAPRIIRLAMAVLRAGFAAETLLRHGRRFAALPPAAQDAMIGRWRDRPVPFALFPRFMETAAILSAYSPKPAAPAAPAAPAVRSAAPRRCEWAVVGSGPGGAVTAALLAEAGRDVLVVEEGPDPAGSAAAPFSFDEMRRLYRAGGLSISIGSAPVNLIEARCLGGGSSVNNGLYFPPQADVLANWRAEYGVEACSPEDLRPHVAACEEALAVAPWAGPLPRASTVLAEGAAALGWTAMAVPKMRDQTPGAPWSDGTRAPYRSMNRSFLPRLRAAGGRIVHGTRAAALRAEGGGWLLETSGGAIRADRVVLAGGALQTPLLLRRSGFRGGVGDGLGLQLILKLVAEFDEEVNAPDLGMPVHQIKTFAPRLTIGCGISTPGQLALCLREHPAVLASLHEAWRRMAVYTVIVTARARGTVRAPVRGATPLVRFAPAAEDWRALAEGQRHGCRALLAAGARAVHLAGGATVRRLSEIDALPGDLSAAPPPVLALHLSSTCAMGEVPERCPTDSFGRLRGARGIQVADASLLCAPPTVNPQGTIMAFAHRNARRLAQEDDRG